MNKQTIRDVDVAGKRVLVRVDFNVPLDREGHVSDATRLREALPTINYLRERGARVILMSHLGRPDGQVKEGLRMAPVAAELQRLLGAHVEYVKDCVGPEVEAAVQRLQPGGVLLLENLRFHSEEEANDPGFSRQLAALGDLYVDDAFGTAHRAHASTEGVTHYLPAVAGLLMEKELASFARILEHPERPFVAIIGGAKVSSKIGVLEHLLDKVNRLIIGGGMANAFLKAQGYEVGRSLLEADKVDVAADLMRRAAGAGVEVLLPVDAVVTDRLEAEAPCRVVPVDAVPPDELIADIGPATIERFGQALADAKTVLWNGPLGVFEVPPFAAGTRALAAIVGRSNAVTVIGGGDTVAAVEQAGCAARMTHISTGGGASLELLEGRVLPGVAALRDRA
ncbi:MAG TPA: phosphoglycerate kinase [Chloroflexota bacterium]|jgi:phosphoglycerate kinase